MSTANTLGLGGDILYLETQKFINLASRTLSLHENDEPDLRNLLKLVRVIMNQTTSSISESKQAGEKPRWTTQTDPGSRVNGVMQRYAGSIGQQIALQDGTNDSVKTWKILEGHPEIPLKTKAVLALVAFATMYGKVRLVALVNNSNQLAKSITLLKQQPDIQRESDLKQWFQTLSRVIKVTLDVADSVMDLKEPQLFLQNTENVIRTPMLLPTAVYRIVNIVVICWAQVVDIYIKQSRKDIISHRCVLEAWERELNNKRLEIEGNSAKEEAPQPRTVPDEQPQARSLPGFWQKVCGLLTLGTVKSERRTVP